MSVSQVVTIETETDYLADTVIATVRLNGDHIAGPVRARAARAIAVRAFEMYEGTPSKLYVDGELVDSRS